IRWVKDTFPPRERARWLLMTMRLSASSLAGTARTLVAVGTVSEAFMFLTTLAAAPRSGICLAPAAGAFAAGLAAGLAALPSLGFAAGAGWLFSGCAFFGWGCWGCCACAACSGRASVGAAAAGAGE